MCIFSNLILEPVKSIGCTWYKHLLFFKNLSLALNLNFKRFNLSFLDVTLIHSL